MKKLIILILLSVFAPATQAQTFAEWFRQKKTQQKYLIQQIAAFQIYLGYVQKGYSITQKGLTTISDIKNGELNLYSGYFRSFQNVNPKIKNYAKVADIIAMQVTIVQAYKQAYTKVKESNAFHPDEAGYIHRVFSRLLDDSAGTIDELIDITTANKLEMKDDERLRRINALYLDMQDKYTFAQSFGNEAMVLAAIRIQEKKDIQTSRILNGIKHE